MVLRLDLVKDNRVVGESPVDLGGFKEFVEYGFDGVFAGESVGE